MIILHSLDQLSSVPGPVALAIGVFDGLYLGHQEVIRTAQEHAAQHHGTAVVIDPTGRVQHVFKDSDWQPTELVWEMQKALKMKP